MINIIFMIPLLIKETKKILIWGEKKVKKIIFIIFIILVIIGGVILMLNNDKNIEESKEVTIKYVSMDDILQIMEENKRACDRWYLDNWYSAWSRSHSAKCSKRFTESPTSKRITKWYEIVPNVIAKVSENPFPVCIWKATQRIVAAVANSAIRFMILAIESPVSSWS